MLQRSVGEQVWCKSVPNVRQFPGRGRDVEIRLGWHKWSNIDSFAIDKSWVCGIDKCTVLISFSLEIRVSQSRLLRYKEAACWRSEVTLLPYLRLGWWQVWRKCTANLLETLWLFTSFSPVFSWHKCAVKESW